MSLTQNKFLSTIRIKLTHQTFNYPALLFVRNNGPLISYYHTGKRLDNDNDDFRAKSGC